MFFVFDQRNKVALHLWPVFKGLAGSRNGLIAVHDHLLQTELSKRLKRDHVALNRAVALNYDCSIFEIPGFSLQSDCIEVVSVGCWNHHRNKRIGSESRITGRNPNALTSVSKLQTPYF